MGVMSSQQLELLEFGRNVLKPMPHLSGSEWADRYFNLSPESSSIPGKWKTRPWQRGILDAMTDYRTKILVLKKPTRVGFTKMLNAMHAYYIHQRPCVQLHYQPTDDEAKGYAEDEFEPMVRDNPEVSALIDQKVIRGRVKKEKTVKKSYPGGYIEILGSESDRNLNRRTAKVAVGDEVDTWKREAGKAGDPVTMMLRRTSDFWDRKNIIGGKPIRSPYDPEAEEIDEGMSIIDWWYHQGTMEVRHLPCPHCGAMQVYEWEDLRWEKELDGSRTIHRPETAHFVCIRCGEPVRHEHLRWMDERGKWVAKNPDAMRDGVRSFHLWAMLSYSPNVSWKDIVSEYLAAMSSPLKMKAFYNEVLARPYEEEYDRPSIVPQDHIAPYDAEVPDGVLVLTAGVDVQKNRLECEVVGWGAYEESWGVCYRIFHGDTSKPDVWRQLDEFLLKHFYTEDGGKMRIYAAAIDSGYRSTTVYGFCKSRYGRNVFAVKGAKQINAPIAPLRSKVRKPKNGKVPLFVIGVNEAKNVIHSHITTEEHGPGYMHWPSDPAYDEEYFRQLTAEKKMKNGRWEKVRERNEALDVRVYAYVALQLAGVDLELLAERRQRLGAITAETKKRRRVILSRGVR